MINNTPWIKKTHGHPKAVLLVMCISICSKKTYLFKFRMFPSLNHHFPIFLGFNPHMFLGYIPGCYMKSPWNLRGVFTIFLHRTWVITIFCGVFQGQIHWRGAPRAQAPRRGGRRNLHAALHAPGGERAATAGAAGAHGERMGSGGESNGIHDLPWGNHRKTIGKWWFNGI